MRRGDRLCSVRPADPRSARGPGARAFLRIAGCAAAVWLAACGAAFVLTACGARPAAPPPSHEIPPEREFLQQVDRTRGVKDIFTPLRDPPFVPAADAPGMSDDELVLGLDLGTAQAAYPVNYLNHHEIVEHRLAETDLLACWCPLCRTGVVHVREIDGKKVSFGHSGWLWHNAYLLYDTETGSLWHHYWGAAMSGPLRGRTLRRLPTLQMTWGAWRREHPGTLVLRKPDLSPPERPTDVDTYARRNSILTFGFAVDVGARSRFLRWGAFPDAGVVEDVLEGVPYVVARDPDSLTAVAWDRRVDGVTLSFARDTGPDGRPVLRELGGTRSWFLRSGTPVPGTDAVPHLAALHGSVWEDAAWRLQHPRDDPGEPAAGAPGRR